MRRSEGMGVRGGPVRAAFRRSYIILLGVGLFSGAINILALTGSFYMLQVYDRVLPSHSVPTLVGLSVLMAGLYVANGFLDFFRVRVMTRVGVRFDDQLREHVFSAVQLLPLRMRQGGDGLQPVRDLDQIRGFLSGLGPTAFFDMPWVPIYLGVVYLLHPALGAFAVAGALSLVCLTFLTDVKSAEPLKEAAKSASKRLAFGEAARRNAEVVRAMGLGGQLQKRWTELNDTHLSEQLKAADVVGGIGTLSKVLRLVLQSGMLGLGAYFVIRGELSAGAIIAGSIILSRALAPIETSIAHWRGFVSARQSYRRLVDLFQALAVETGDKLELPVPKASLTVENVSAAPPGAPRAVVHNVSFQLTAGDGLGIIGPSGSGKSTLARALVGVWRPAPNGGVVRLDGASLDQWTPELLGRHIGYLPQSIELFEGTVAENIARFDRDAPDAAIVDAAQHAGVHDVIVRLPEGYQTQVGEAGLLLSAGQRQRIGLARALYGDPFFVVLDEPNSNLDHIGDVALTQAILSVRARSGIVIVIAHRPSALAAVDTVMALVDGRMQAFGPKDEVLRKMMQPVPEPQRGSGDAPGAMQGAAAGLRVVKEQRAGPRL
jgi:ATP-binding cassette, subfamily C, type I secretion system permease/ATPase